MGKTYKKLIVFIVLILFILLGSQIGIFKALSLYFLVFFGFVLYKFWVSRDLIILNLKMSEAKLFGKPLDRDQWNKGELKKRKFKVVWKKPKGKRLKK